MVHSHQMRSRSRIVRKGNPMRSSVLDGSPNGRAALACASVAGSEDTRRDGAGDKRACRTMRAPRWRGLDGPIMSEIAGAMSVLRASRGASPRVHATKPSRNDNGEGRGRQTTVRAVPKSTFCVPLSRLGRKWEEKMVGVEVQALCERKLSVYSGWACRGIFCSDASALIVSWVVRSS